MADTTRRRVWDMVVMVATVFAAVEIPLRLSLGFELRGPLRTVDWVITGLFALDMVLQFRTPFRRGRHLVTDRRAIAQHYLRTWFLIDLLATVPFDLLTLGLPIPSRVMRVLRLLRIARVVRLLRLAELMRSWHVHVVSPAIMRLLFFGFWVAMLAHWIACGWLALGGVSPGQSPVYTYVVALYWAVTTLTTVGYGDITPVGIPQMLYTMLVMMLGVGVYGYVIGNVATLLTHFDRARTRHEQRLDHITHFMVEHGITKDLQARVQDYFDFLWETGEGRHEAEVVASLPRSLRFDIALQLNGQIIERVPLFHGASDELVREVVASLEQVVVLPGDDIVRKGDIGHEMYFITSGEVEIVDGEGNSLIVLGEGSFFGELALLHDRPRTASVRALDFCELYRLEKADFLRIIDHYPSFATRMEHLAAERRRRAE